MYELDENEDVDELLPAARTVLDRLAIVMHAQTLRYAGILIGLSGSFMAIAAFGYLTFGHHSLNVRFFEEIYQLSPLFFIASIYALFLFSMAYYRSSIERLQIRLTRRRLDEAIAEAVELDPSR